MKKSISPLPVILVLAVALVAAAIYVKNRPSKPDATTKTPATGSNDSQAHRTPLPTTDDPSPVRPGATPFPAQAPGFSDPVVERDELFEVTEGDMTPFLKSEIAEKWKRELGYTESEMVQAQRDLRAQGYDETAVNDPGIILRHLPPRQVGRLRIAEIVVPSEVDADEPVPFTIRGTKPSPSWSFVRYDVNVQGNIIRLNAVGNADGDNEAGLGGEIELTGEIEPLKASGEYRVIVPELGPNGEWKISVR